MLWLLTDSSWTNGLIHTSYIHDNNPDIYTTYIQMNKYGAKHNNLFKMNIISVPILGLFLLKKNYRKDNPANIYRCRLEVFFEKK